MAKFSKFITGKRAHNPTQAADVEVSTMGLIYPGKFTIHLANAPHADEGEVGKHATLQLDRGEAQRLCNALVEWLGAQP